MFLIFFPHVFEFFFRLRQASKPSYAVRFDGPTHSNQALSQARLSAAGLMLKKGWESPFLQHD
jgi:hypothetical protein